MAAQIVTGLTLALNVGAQRRRAAERLGDDGGFLLARQIAHGTLNRRYSIMTAPRYHWYLSIQ